MQQLFISQGLSERISSLLTPPQPIVSDSMSWYCHNIPTANGEFVILMEEQTHYCVLIHTTSSRHLDELPTLFKHRLLREVVNLTEANEKLSKRVEIAVFEMCKEVQFTIGLDYKVSGDLFEITCELQAIMANLKETHDQDLNEQHLTMQINRIPFLDEHGQKQVPLVQFQQFWLSKLGITLASPSTIVG